MKKRALLAVASAAFLLTVGCSRSPADAFSDWVRAVQSRDAGSIVRLDRDYALRTAALSEAELTEFASDLDVHLALPAATAYLETGFGVEPSGYHRKLFFPEGARFKVRSQEQRGTDGARLLVEVNYPREVAPVYVTEVQVVWHGPAETSYRAPERPIPVFSSGYLEAGHPFLANPGYRGYELRLHAGAVRTAVLKVALVRDPGIGWTIAELVPQVAENDYWD